MASETQITKSDEVAALLERRHIPDDDIRQVISNAEATDDKLFQPGGNRYLAKMRLGNITLNVEYSVTDGGYTIHTAYSHRMQILADNKQ